MAEKTVAKALEFLENCLEKGGWIKNIQDNSVRFSG